MGAGVLKKVRETFGSMGNHIQKGKSINDYASLSYQGSNFRTFNFAWDLIPHSLQEAEKLAEIIKIIRKHSLPSYNSTIIDYPHLWDVTPLVSEGINVKLLDCVITNLTVNYTPEGVLRRFNSGHSTSVNLELEFKELYRASSDDI
jgi:hypothetical protein